MQTPGAIQAKRRTLLGSVTMPALGDFRLTGIAGAGHANEFVDFRQDGFVGLRRRR
jgi:hypothetical protein